jgi:hypothetical protein
MHQIGAKLNTRDGGRQVLDLGDAADIDSRATQSAVTKADGSFRVATIRSTLSSIS